MTVSGEQSDCSGRCRDQGHIRVPGLDFGRFEAGRAVLFAFGGHVNMRLIQERPAEKAEDGIEPNRAKDVRPEGVRFAKGMIYGVVGGLVLWAGIAAIYLLR